MRIFKITLVLTLINSALTFTYPGCFNDGVVSITGETFITSKNDTVKNLTCMRYFDYYSRVPTTQDGRAICYFKNFNLIERFNDIPCENNNTLPCSSNTCVNGFYIGENQTDLQRMNNMSSNILIEIRGGNDINDFHRSYVGVNYSVANYQPYQAHLESLGTVFIKLGGFCFGEICIGKNNFSLLINPVLNTSKLCFDPTDGPGFCRSKVLKFLSLYDYLYESSWPQFVQLNDSRGEVLTSNCNDTKQLRSVFLSELDLGMDFIHYRITVKLGRSLLVDGECICKIVDSKVINGTLLLVSDLVNVAMSDGLNNYLEFKYKEYYEIGNCAATSHRCYSGDPVVRWSINVIKTKKLPTFEFIKEVSIPNIENPQDFNNLMFVSYVNSSGRQNITSSGCALGFNSLNVILLILTILHN